MAIRFTPHRPSPDNPLCSGHWPNVGKLLSTTLSIALRIAIGMTLSACSSPEKNTKSGIYLDNAYIKTVIPGRSMTAAYATIRNHDPQTLCLVHFSASFAQSVELHRTVAVGAPASGRVTMQRMPELCLEPEQEVQLAPGGMHLMVMGISDLPGGFTPAAAPQSAPITLGTRSGRAFVGQFRLQPFTQ